VVVDPFEAINEDAPVIQESMDNNIQANFNFRVGNTDEAFSQADHVLKARLKTPRLGSNPIETRGVIASYNRRNGLLEIWSSTQLPYEVRYYVARSLGMVEQNI